MPDSAPVWRAVACGAGALGGGALSEPASTVATPTAGSTGLTGIVSRKARSRRLASRLETMAMTRIDPASPAISATGAMIDAERCGSATPARVGIVSR